MSEMELKTEAQIEKFTEEFTEELSDEALDREGSQKTCSALCWCGSILQN
jgi:hypothetical protein